MKQAITFVLLVLMLGACRSDYDNYIHGIRLDAKALGDPSTWHRGQALHDTLQELLQSQHGHALLGSQLDSVIANAVLMEELLNWHRKVQPLGVNWDMMKAHARACLRSRWCNDPPNEGLRVDASLRTDMDTAAVMSYLWKRFREKDRTVVHERDLIEPGRLLRGLLVPNMHYALSKVTDPLGVSGMLIEGEWDVKDEDEAGHDDKTSRTHLHNGGRAMKAKWERMADIRELAQLGSFDLGHLRPQESEGARRTIDSTLAKVYGEKYAWTQSHLPFRTLYGSGLEVSVHGYSQPGREPGHTCYRQVIRVLQLDDTRLDQ